MDKNQTPIIGSKNIPKGPKRKPTKRGLKFKPNGDGTCKLVGTGLFLEKEVMIPAFHKRMPVIKIGNNAFLFCKKIKKVIIPGTVTSIGGAVFYNCANLTSVTIPNSVTSIGIGSFSYCSKLTSIAIPDSMRKIGERAFSYCSGLTSITFKGTKAQWRGISKGYDWNHNSSITKVICTDGSVSL